MHMTMNRFILLAALLSFCAFSCAKPGNGGADDSAPETPATPELPLEFTVIGDSYSTYEGWNNAGNNGFAVYYPRTAVPDVTDVSHTWWHQLHSTDEFELEKLNTYSGSVISYRKGNVLEHGDKRSFLARLTRADMGSPDVILILGGTNDSWHNTDADLGEYKYEDIVQKDLSSFRPAFAWLLISLKKNYPNAKIYNITNSGRGGMDVGGLTQGVADSMEEICRHLNVPNIILPSTLDAGKTSRHPNKAGMKIIFDEVYSQLKKDLL